METSEVKAFFDEVAGEWDKMRLSFYDERVLDQLAERTRLDGSQTVVDVGTGTGFVAAGLAPRAARVIAVDSSLGMLEVAGSNLDRLGVTNVELVEGSLDALPLPDDSVNAAVANMVLHHAQEPAAMLAEMARVTRPGGWVGITDEVEHPYEWLRTEQADVWLGFARRRSRAFRQRAAHPLRLRAARDAVIVDSTTSVEVADIATFIASGRVPAVS